VTGALLLHCTLAVLVGWPALQIVSVLLARPIRREIESLAFRLNSDPTYGEADRAAVDELVRSARGQPASAIFPVLIPVAIFVMAFVELFGRHRPSKATHPEQVAERARRGKELRREIDELDVRLGGSPSEPRPVLDDPRYRQLARLVERVQTIRAPVSVMLTVLLALPALPWFAFAYGAREAFSIIPQLARRFAVTLRFMALPA
jgi:hypothetical protein